MANPTPIEIELASRIVSRRSLLPFTMRLNPQYMAGWVHADVARRLEQFSEDVAKKKSPRLMLLMPPRSGKSELCSRNFPPWHLGRNPDHEIISCSYNVSLAMTFSKKVKGVLEDESYHPVFDARLDPNDKSAEEWSLQSSRGAYVAAGVGGGITGKGAHVLIIDDPLKNAEEADSAETREKLKEWYDSTAYTRLAPGGGVLIVQCMTGDTPVLMPDGSTKRLDAVQPGDMVVTYEGGRRTTARVAAKKSNGNDKVLRITTESGRTVRANGRHPFLVMTDEGLKWIRARKLTTGHRIVAVPGSGVSGSVKRAQPTVARRLQSVEAYVPPITISTDRPAAIDLLPSTPLPIEPSTLNTATDSPRKRTTLSWLHKVASVLFVAIRPRTACQDTGKITSASITAMKPAKCAGSYATTAIPHSGTSDLIESLSPWPTTSDFTTDRVSKIEQGGVAEVFDLQVDRTENFIANGLVSHNTWWHDDDLAGRLQEAMKDPEADQFMVVKYPAIAEHDEFLDEDTDLIVYESPVNGKLLRRAGEALHPERYDLKQLMQIKRTISPRFWSALYQQNPVPDDGVIFTKEYFRQGELPRVEDCNVFIAWDFAISEKKQNDYTVGTVGLQDNGDRLHVADQMRFKSGDALYIVESILNLAQKWHSKNMVLGFEDGQIWRAIESLLKKRMRERQMYPPTVVLKPITDKLARSRPLQGRMQQGMVSFRAGAAWYDALKSEMLRFPAGAHDDQVDSLAWLVQMVIGRAPPMTKSHKQKPLKSWRDGLSTNRSGSFMAV